MGYGVSAPQPQASAGGQQHDQQTPAPSRRLRQRALGDQRRFHQPRIVADAADKLDADRQPLVAATRRNSDAGHAERVHMRLKIGLPVLAEPLRRLARRGRHDDRRTVAEEMIEPRPRRHERPACGVIFISDRSLMP